MELLLFFGCLVAIGVGVFVTDCLFTRRRLKRLQQQAQRLGFSFDRTAQPFEGSDIHGLSVLEQDPSAVVINVMKGKVGGCRTLIFELAHLNPACSGVASTTMAGFRCPSGQLPILQIGKESIGHRVADALQHRSDIDVGQGREFFLHCPDQRQAHDFLTPARMETLRRVAAQFCVESSRDWLLIYRPGVRIRPEALPDFMQTASLIASTLLESMPAAASAG